MDGRTLLIHKKRGFGKGKILAPGGKVEPDESLEVAASRETMEEVGISVNKLKKCGYMEFFFGQEKMPDWIVHVFRSNDFSGTAIETEEAKPFWASVDRMPYDEMWEDCKIWMPLIFKDKLFHGKFLFDKDVKNMLDYEITEGSVV